MTFFLVLNYKLAFAQENQNPAGRSGLLWYMFVLIVYETGYTYAQ